MSAYAIEYLPESLRDIVDVIGLAATLELVEHFGGIALYVPSELTSEHRIVKALGAAAAAKLWEVYQADTLIIPRCNEALRRARNAEIIARNQAGATVAVLALEYALTQRAVWYILADADAPSSPQISLL